MKNILTTIMLTVSIIMSAQVGISTTNPQATLDITASNQVTPANTDGILIPRVDAFPTINPTVTQDAMLVYLTTISGADLPGFYYWNNATTTWLGFGGETAGWELTGNAGTVNGTNFLGTTDAQDLDIRTNNIIHNRFTTSGQLEFLNTEGSVYIGENAGAADDLTNGLKENVFVGALAGENITTGASSSIHGRYSTGVGYNVMNALTTGAANTAVGHNSSASMTTGLNNASVGLDALKNAIDADNNVAIGVDAIENITADNNTGVGYRALRGGTGTTGTGFQNTALGSGAGKRTTNGTNNVFVGYDADEFNTLGIQNVILGSDAGAATGSATTASGRVLIGYRAGRSATSADNVLMIENSSSVTPLVYGEFDNDILRIGGQLQIGSSDDTTAGAIYSFPVVDGTLGQVLTTDGLGDVTWQNGGVASAWDLTGNAGTVNGTNFLGTTDAVDLDIRTNNIIHNRFTTNGQLEFLNTGGSVNIGENAGTADDLNAKENVLIGLNAGANVTTGATFGYEGASNVAIGSGALESLTLGYANTAVGRNALAGDITGNSNVAIGSSAMNDADGAIQSVAVGNTAAGRHTGNGNVALGFDAMAGHPGTAGNNVAIGRGAANYIVDGFANVAVGENADQLNQDGTFNSIIGRSAGLVSGTTAIGSMASLSRRVFIGANAGGNFTTQSDLLAIDISSTRTPLVYGEFDNDILRVGGQLQIGSSDNTTAGAIYSFPVVDGASGQALTTDGAGNVTWQNGGSGADADWFGQGTTASPTAITENIFTNGNVGIGDITPNGNLHVSSTGDTLVIVEGDSDNSGEDDNPEIQLLQDGGDRSSIQLEGTSGVIATGTRANALILHTRNGESSAPIQVVANSILNTTFDTDGQVQLNQYTTGTSFTGTATSLLAVDASGNIIQEPLSAGGTDWSVSGNAGTTNGTHFLGTTDPVDLDIRTNNIIHNRFTQSGQLEFLNTGGSVRIGENAGALDDLTDNRNVLIGQNTGIAMITAANNVAVGADALRNNISGSSNVALGRHTLQNNTTGEDNVAIGTSALRGSGADADRNVAIGYAAALPMTGDDNVAIGYNVMASSGGAGASNTSVGSNSSNRLTTGSDNVAIGTRAEHFNQAGSNNTILGANAGLAFGSSRSFSGRVIIGNGAGQSFDQDNLLVIENTTSTIPLIGGDFATDRVGINLDPRTSLTSTLTVGGDIEATGSLISGTTTYPDYVFENYFLGQSTINSNYLFTPLNEAISFVKANGHLPNVKSYKEVKAEGMVLDITKTSVKNLEKIEENFLYIAELNENNKELKQENELLKARLELIVNRLNALENKK